MQNKREVSSLEKAAEIGDLQQVRELQAADKENLEKLCRINKLLLKGETSSENIDDDTYRLLWRKIEQQTYALMSAASNGHLGVVEELLKYEDAIEKRHDFDCIYAGCRDPEAPEYSKEALASIHAALRWAAQGNHLEVVRMLLAHGAAADHQYINNNGATLLMEAAINGSIHIVREFLSYEEVVKTINTKDKRGRTALMFAADTNAEYNNPEKGYETVATVRELLNKGALIAEKDSRGNTALSLATQHGHNNIMRMLEPPKAEISKAFFDTPKSAPRQNDQKHENIQSKVGLVYNSLG